MTPYESGQLAGQIALEALILAGVSAGIRGWIRPGGNRFCYAGLTLTFGGIAVAMLLSIAKIQGGGSSAGAILYGLAGLSALMCGLCGVVLSSIGLFQVYRWPKKWNAGAAAGWLGAGAGLLLGLGVVVALVAKAVGRDRPGTFANWKPDTAETTADGRWESSALNYSLRKPGGQWQPEPQTPGREKGRFTLSSRKSRSVFTMIPEQLPAATDIEGDTPSLIAAAKHHLQNVDSNVRILPEKPQKIGGLDGTTFEANWTLGAKPLFSVHWVTAGRGWAYQLMMTGDASSADQVRKDAQEVFAGFSQVDTNRAAPGWEALAGSQYRSKFYPYTISLQGLSWRPAPNLSNNFPAADFSAKGPGGCTLTVVPAAFPSPPPPSEAVFKALLSRTPLGAAELVDRKPWKSGALSGETCSWQSTIGGTPWLVRLRFEMGERTAFLVLADGPVASNSSAKLDGLLDRVALEDSPPDRGPEGLPEPLAHSEGLFLNDVGLYYYKSRNMARAAGLFHSAAGFWPDNAVVLVNECEALGGLRQYANGLARLDAQPAIVATNLPLQAARAFFQWQTGDTNSALRGYAAIFDRGYNRVSTMNSFCALLLEMGDTNQAVSRVEAFASTNGTTDARLLQAKVLRRGGEAGKAVKVMEAERDRAGLTEQVGFELALSYLAALNPADTLKTCDALLDRGYEGGPIWYLKGLAESQKKDHVAAKKAFETAARLAPEDETIRAALARASAMLGQGDNFAIKDAIEPVSVPQELAASVPAPLPRNEVEAYGAQYLDRTAAILYRRGADHRLTEHFRVQIYNETGLERFRTLRFDFDPLGQAIYVNELIVRDSSGRVIATGKNEDYYVTDDSVHAAQGMASNHKQLNIPVAGLQAGMTLEATITWKYLAGDPDFSWYQETLERQTPAARLLTVVKGDVGLLAWDASPELKTVRGEGFAAWSREHAPAWVSEGFEPAFIPFRPRLSIVDAGRTWAAEATNYLSQIAGKMVPDAETKAAHLIQVAPDAGREEQIRVLVRYVQNQCSYRAIEFGRRARIPSSPGETIRHQYGDCKDQAVLVQQLLALSGIEAHLALASTAGPIVTNLPSLDQFNHMIVYVPDPKGNRFIDTTARAADPFLTARWALGGSKVFVLDPKAPRFEDVPPLTADDSVIRIDRRISSTNETGLVLTERVEATGLSATWLRSVLSGQNGETFKVQAQRVANPIIPGLEVDSLTCEGFDNSLLPLRVSMKAHVTRYFQRAGSQLVGPIPTLWETLWIAPGSILPRHSPLEIRRPWRILSTNHVEWPAGYAGPSPDAMSGHQTGDFVVADVFATGAGGKRLIAAECTGLAGLFAAERGPERQRALADALRLMSPALVLEKAPDGK